MNEINVTGMWTEPLQAFTYVAIRERELERGEGREEEVVTQFPSLTSIPYSVMLGNFAWSKLGGKFRWVQSKNAILDRGVILTPGDIARSYLSIKFPKWRGRVSTAQYQSVIAVKRSHPLYAKPGKYDDMIYYDLRSAYWSILKVIGWNVDYFPHKFLGAGEEMDDFPFPHDKLARNCLVTAALPSPAQMWNGHNILLVNSRKPTVNLVLWACVMDVLHGVAWDMLQIGAVYVHTDGYIIPKSREYLAEEVFESWGLPCSTKGEGDATIHGAGDYDMPHHQSRLRRLKEFPIDNLHNPGVEWLRPRIKRLASLRLKSIDRGKAIPD